MIEKGGIKMIGKVKYVGKNFGGNLIDGEIYECIGISSGGLRIIDRACLIDGDKTGYLYSAIEPGSMVEGDDRCGRWEIVEDPEGKIQELFDSYEDAVRNSKIR